MIGKASWNGGGDLRDPDLRGRGGALGFKKGYLLGPSSPALLLKVTPPSVDAPHQTLT